ncbi:hypothetical protein B0H14DRAFT_2891736, partial [Mycena olivaceomarginata]
HSTTHPDPLSAHYSRLESLLDSALATLTLIRDHTQSPDLPALTGHMTEVLQAFAPWHHHDPIPTPAPSLSPIPILDQTCHTTPPLTPLYRNRAEIHCRRSSAHECPMDHKGESHLTFLHDEHFASDDIMKQSPELWKNHFCPRVDRGGSWHNIVIHRVPLEETISGAQGWLQSSGVDAEAISLMCSELDLASREIASLRVSLSSKKHADFLVQNGALTLGSQCRSKPPS